MTEQKPEPNTTVKHFRSAEVFDAVAEPVADGETYRAGEDGYDFTSRADNLVAEPENLWLSSRED